MCLSFRRTQIRISAVSYRVPQAVTHVVKSYDGFFDSVCPRCRGIVPYEYIRFCPICGQRLLWALLDDAIELSSLSELPDQEGLRFSSFIIRLYWKNALRLLKAF